MKIAAIFVVLLLVLLPVMGATVTGDGTLKGQLQTFISYGLSLTGFLLCLLTIIVSIYSLSSDIEQKQIYTVITKPIRRFQLLLGKLLGVILLDVVLLTIFSSVIYGITVYMPKFYKATEAESVQAKNEFYTARTSLRAPESDVSNEVDETYNKLMETGQLPKNVSPKKVKARLTSIKKLEKRAAGVGHDILWEFHDVKPVDPNESLFIRFKYDVTLDPLNLEVYGRWVVGDYQYIRYGVAGKTPIYDRVHKHSVRTFHEIEIPANIVPEDGHLAVVFVNIPLNNTVIMFPLEDGLGVLYKADSFTGNFIRAVTLILLRVIFLACLGILASSFLSFPVATLFCFAIFFTATFSSFCLESFDYLSEDLGSVYRYTVRPVILLLPQFDKFNPTNFLVTGRLLSWFFLARIAFSMVFIKAVLLLLLALLIFSFKEIAKIVI